MKDLGPMSDEQIEDATRLRKILAKRFKSYNEEYDEDLDENFIPTERKIRQQKVEYTETYELLMKMMKEQDDKIRKKEKENQN